MNAWTKAERHTPHSHDAHRQRGIVENMIGGVGEQVGTQMFMISSRQRHAFVGWQVNQCGVHVSVYASISTTANRRAHGVCVRQHLSTEQMARTPDGNKSAPASA
jgi:hypothetical protein